MLPLRVYVIQGLTGQVDMWWNRSAFRRNFPELADAQFAAGGAPPCILIYVDCWSSVGGRQFLDSPGTGRNHTYLCDEIVPFVDRLYRTLPEAPPGRAAGYLAEDPGLDLAVRLKSRPGLRLYLGGNSKQASQRSNKHHEFSVRAVKRHRRTRREGQRQRRPG